MIKELLIQELNEEAEITKKFFNIFPEDKLEYKPHEKSMSLKELMNHIVEIVGWPAFILETEKIDFTAGDYQPSNLEKREDFESSFNKLMSKSIDAINSSTDEVLLNNHWKMMMGEQLLQDYTKYEAIRHSLNQLTHHRAQLGVYYRLNDISVPGSYGPSADD